jgi:beta-glucanase (GH16 family)
MENILPRANRFPTEKGRIPILHCLMLRFSPLLGGLVLIALGLSYCGIRIPGAWDDESVAPPPATIRDIGPVDGMAPSAATDEDYVRTAFRDDFYGLSVDAQAWQVATWMEHGGQTGPERVYAAEGRLNMIFENDSVAGYLSSAMQSRQEYLYGRWEARLKPSSVPGVLNSMYTIDWDDTADPGASNDGTKQEIDIEFLTYTFGENSGRVHFAVHAAGKESFQTNPDILLDFNPSDDFHVWGFEVTPQQIQFFVDDRILLTYTYSGNPVAITAPYMLKFNAWSQAHWVNGPPEADIETRYLIDWVKFTPWTGSDKTD